MWLTEEEIRQMTGYKLPAYQERHIREMWPGVRVKRNARGRLVVLRADVEGVRKADLAAKRQPMRFPWETTDASPSHP